MNSFISCHGFLRILLKPLRQAADGGFGRGGLSAARSGNGSASNSSLLNVCRSKPLRRLVIRQKYAKSVECGSR